MQKWQKALAHIIKHPKKSWNFVTKRDKESFGMLDFTYENGEWTGSIDMLGGIGLPSGPSDAVEIFSYIEAFTIAFVIIGILTLIVMIWFITVVYRLGSQANTACENGLVDNWKFIGEHLAIALILSMFLPGLGHLYLIYVLIRAEMTFTEVRTQSTKNKANNLSQDPKPKRPPHGKEPLNVPSSIDVSNDVDYDMVKDNNSIQTGKTDQADVQKSSLYPMNAQRDDFQTARDHLKPPDTSIEPDA